MRDIKKLFVENFKKDCPSQRVLVAVSTGVDSMVLLHLLCSLPENIRPNIDVAYVDHKLRIESSEETSYIIDFCKKEHLKLHMCEWSIGLHPSKGTEEAARKFRYDFFSKIMNDFKIDILLTAHHADDQAETFLMKLIRGGNIRQLQGIKRIRNFTSGRLVRLLLPFSKKEIQRYAQNENIIYFEDITNSEDTYFRNRVRHQLVPKMKKENSKFLQHISLYEEQLTLLLDATDEQAENYLKIIKNDEKLFSIKKWLELSANWRYFVLKKVLEKELSELSEKKLHQVEQFLTNKNKPQGFIKLEFNIFLTKNYDFFYFENKKKQDVKSQINYQLELNCWKVLNDKESIGVFECFKQDVLENDDFFCFSNLALMPLMVRHREVGDKIHTEVGTQKVKKILIDKKVSKEVRNKIWIVTTKENHILWIPGIRKSDLSERLVNDKMQYMIIFRNKV